MNVLGFHSFRGRQSSYNECEWSMSEPTTVIVAHFRRSRPRGKKKKKKRKVRFVKGTKQASDDEKKKKKGDDEIY
jgi:hypothetical protein